MVRSLSLSQFGAPWPFIKKATGWRKIGPVVIERHKWPGQNREIPELSPKYKQNNNEALRGYTDVQQMGFKDPRTGKYTHIPEMQAELIVPDLSNFELKPYVSYKTDVEIEKRLLKFEENLSTFGSEEEAIAQSKDTERWPPPNPKDIWRPKKENNKLN